MIRLPPTSISLSENDISHHLRQLGIYQGLLAQGFKRKEIVRYHEEHNRQQRLAPKSQRSRQSPSCVEMVVARFPTSPEPISVPDETPDVASHTGQSPDSSPVLPHVVARHAPRQSSLLRFAKTVSPGSSPAEDVVETLEPEYIFSPRTPRISYRPRTETYSYDQSEADDPQESEQPEDELEHEFSALALASSPFDMANEGAERSAQDMTATQQLLFNPGVRAKSPVSSPLRAEAATFHPHMLPPPFSATRRASSNQYSLPSPSQSSNQTHGHYEAHTRSTASLPISTTSRSSTFPDVPRPQVPSSVVPKSPEPISSPYNSSARPPSSVSLAPPIPVTPTPVRRLSPPRTEPRGLGRQNLDGTSFSVYDDSVPASAQPQTPADLSRRMMLTEADAAYTAPPGRIHSRSITVQQRNQGLGSLETGEQSPTMRAIGIRERRNREYLRSARVGSLRWMRWREEDEAIAQGNHRTETRDTWRDDLDADRVGEENFGDDLHVAATIRIVSGGRLIETLARQGPQGQEN